MSEHDEQKNAEGTEETQESKPEAQPEPHPRAVGIIGDRVLGPSRPGSTGFGIATLIIVGIIGVLAGGLIVWALMDPELKEASGRAEELETRVQLAVENMGLVGNSAIRNAITAVKQRNFAVAEDHARVARECTSLAAGVSETGAFIKKATDALDTALDSLARNDAAALEDLEKAQKAVIGIGRSTAKEAATALEEAAPAPEEAVPTTDEAAPAGAEAAPAGEEAAPADEEAAPATDEQAPADEEAVDEEAAE